MSRRSCRMSLDVIDSLFLLPPSLFAPSVGSLPPDPHDRKAGSSRKERQEKKNKKGSYVSTYVHFCLFLLLMPPPPKTMRMLFSWTSDMLVHSRAALIDCCAVICVCMSIATVQCSGRVMSMPYTTILSCPFLNKEEEEDDQATNKKDRHQERS